jgi:hypothetical protein
LEPALGLRVVATEVSFGDPVPGRIDALAIDDALCPVVIEFKRTATCQAICQCLLYRSWLESHHDSVALRVAGRYGLSVASQLNWGKPRVVCLVGTLDPSVETAARQLHGQVEVIQLIRYTHALFVTRSIL